MKPSDGVGDLLVVGFGNPLMADDGFGSAVIDILRDADPPPTVTATVVPDILHLRSAWQGQPAVWMIDAVERGTCPGTIHRLEHHELLEVSPQSGSAHHLQFGECLRWLLHANPDLRAVRFRLWGAEPATVSAHRGLSPRVAAVVKSVAQEIQNSAAGRTVNEAEEAHAGVP